MHSLFSINTKADTQILSCVCSFAFLVHMTDLFNVFDTFLPQLLHYPNPSDPLNGEAASLLLQDSEAYKRKVQGALLLRAVKI